MKSVAQSFVMRARGVKQTDLAPLHEPHGEIAPGGSLPFKFTPTPPLPKRTDGRFEAPSVSIAGFTQVIPQSQ